MSKDTKEFCRPVHLTAQHDLEDFQSGEESLDSWLRKRAIDNMETGASRTYVICPPSARKVIGYYAICMGQILMIVHAISPDAEAFYLHHGFARLPTDTPTYALDLIKYTALFAETIKENPSAT